MVRLRSFHVRPRVLCLLVVAGGCAPAELSESDAAAIRLAAAAHTVASIAEAPGSIVLVCVSYEGDGARPDLPSAGAGALTVAGSEGCRESDTRLVAVDGGGQAVAVTVRRPEPIGRSRAEVVVFTSTGTDDLAAYTCTIRRRDDAWQAEGCVLDAIS